MNNASIFNYKKLVPLAILIIVLVSLGVIGNQYSKRAYDFYGDGIPTENSEKLSALRLHEKQILTSYGVIDAEKGIYRIPISVAMKRYLQKSEK
ncbi:MAG: hypothetical protein GXO91_07275 [FCB group bacterium]|nr:hypothetical protein [FCB group bacterium]